LLFCHGYANSVPTARDSYRKFQANFLSLFPEGKGILDDVFEFFWPGDERLHFFSEASYPLQISHARESGKLLANYLANLPASVDGPTEIFLIAHSLGNRVILELLREILGIIAGGAIRNNLKFAGIFMMAAAVPVSMVDRGGDLHGPSVTPARRCVLYSPSDFVLWLAFPVGETVGLDGLRPRAVGRFGDPWGQWTQQQKMTGYGHSDYWPRATTSLPFGRFMGFSVPNLIQKNQIVSNPGPVASASRIQSRSTPEA